MHFVRLAMNILGMASVLLATPVLMVAIMFRSFLYHPTHLDAEYVSTIARAHGWKVVELETGPKVRLVGMIRPPLDQHLPWVLFFAGNAMDLESSQWILRKIDEGRGHGLAVFAYRGYDGSTGTPTEAGLLYDAEAIAAWLESGHGVGASNLVLVGQSLGSGVATHLAASLARNGKAVRGLALLSPYTSMQRVFDEIVPFVPIGWAIRDRYDNELLLDDLLGPVIIVHGREDEIVEVAHGRDLARALGDRGLLIVLDGVGHNDLWEHPKTAPAIGSLLD